MAAVVEQSSVQDILAAIAAGERLSPEDALTLFESDDLFAIGEAADRIRQRFHPEGVVTYIIDRNINYTNVCAVVCTFCAFYRRPGHAEGYILDHEAIFKKIEETLAVGGTGVLMQGGLHPNLPLEYYETLLREIKKRYRVHLHCFSAPEIHHFAALFGMSYRDVIKRLMDAGLDSIPGGGAEILDDEIRKRVSTKCNTQEWLDVHRAAHSLSLPTTATMMFGCGETLRHRVNHLERIRRIQDDTGGFTAFIPWSFQPSNTALGKKIKQEASVDEYLKTLAISRLYLDNFRNVQSSWVTQGLKVCQLGLRFGGNDVGSVMLEENVVRAAGAHNSASEETLRTTILDAGFIPQQRDTLYRPIDRSY